MKKDSPKKKESAKPPVIHQGLLLERLVTSVAKSQEEFASKVGLTRQWLKRLYEEEKLSEKNLNRICTTFNIPRTYFEGKVDLPVKNRIEVQEAKEPVIDYITLIAELKKENEELKAQLFSMQAKMIKLLEEVNKKK